MPTKLLIIGISGVTCGGKTTLAGHLKECLPKTNLISQDDYFLAVDDPRHTWIPELNHINYDILSSLDMEKMYNDLESIIQNKPKIDLNQKINIRNSYLTSDTESLEAEIGKKIKNLDLQILIVEGFSIFNYKPFHDKFQLMYYLTLPKNVCFERRAQRIYDPPDCPGYFEQCVWPEHEKQLQEVCEDVKGIKYFDGTLNNPLHEVLLDIKRILDSYSKE